MRKQNTIRLSGRNLVQEISIVSSLAIYIERVSNDLCRKRKTNLIILFVFSVRSLFISDGHQESEISFHTLLRSTMQVLNKVYQNILIFFRQSIFSLKKCIGRMFFFFSFY